MLSILTTPPIRQASDHPLLTTGTHLNPISSQAPVMIVDFLQQHPLIALFLTVGVGFWLGNRRIKGFSIGPVAATLVVGVIVGQAKVVIPDMVKTIFFLFFLFALGYSVGPQFFRSFRSGGVRQLVFAVVEALVCAGVVIGASMLMGYNTAVSTGLYVGSQTASAALGMLGDTVRELPVDAAQRDYMLMIIPACYAVTYVFGTVGSAWYLSVIGPKFMGGLEAVRAEAASIEQAMDGSGTTRLSPGQIKAGREVLFRAFTVDATCCPQPTTVIQLEKRLAAGGNRVVIERIKSGDEVITATNNSTIKAGDIVVVAGRAKAVVNAAPAIGTETADSGLLNFGVERLPVTVSHGGMAGKTLGQLRNMAFMDGIVIASVSRNGHPLPVRSLTELAPGDVVTLVGFERDVVEAAARIGYADAQTNITDMVFVGLGIALGCLIGSFAIRVKGIPMALGVSVGTLIAGLVLGWYRNRRPTFGRIPGPVLWIFNNLGINMFIAVIGISAGAHFLAGLREAGALIFLVGAICTLLTLTIGIFLCRKVFKFTRPETLGCVAGSRCAVAAMGAVVDRLQSNVPNLGYTVTYAVANVSLIFASLLVLFLI